MSKKPEIYRQATLTRKDGESTVRTVTWIPSKGLEVGSRISLQDHVTNEKHTEVWTVSELGEQEIDAKLAHKRAHFWQSYRKRTDA